MSSVPAAVDGRADAAMAGDGHAGWSNWHTWNLHRWITSDEQALSEACVFAHEGAKDFIDWCHDFVWVGMGFEQDPPVSAGTDFVHSGLNEVDFQEIRERLIRSEPGSGH